MRNPVPSSRFHLLAVTLILSTVAVWPIGYTTAEANSSSCDCKVKRSVNHDGTSFVRKCSSNFEKLKNQHDPQNPDIPSNFYGKFQKGSHMEYDDDQYFQQTEPFGSNTAGNADRNYENDGYGYDDDEYDHFNYKRYDSDKDGIDENVKAGKEESNEALAKGGYVPVNKKIAPAEQDLPKTTIELINFHAKNIKPDENFQQTKAEENVKDISFTKSLSKANDNRKESLSENKAKKLMSNQAVNVQKAEETKSVEESGEVKSGSSKISGGKEPLRNTAKKVKAKADENVNANRESVQSEKDTARISSSKENAINVNAGKRTKFDENLKNDARITEKDCKKAEADVRSEKKEEKNSENVKDDSDADYESGITDVKDVNDNVEEDANEKNFPRFTGDYKEYVDSMIDPEIVDNEKEVEDAKDKEERPTQLGDHRSDVQCRAMEHQGVANSNSDTSSKYVSKKDVLKELSDSKCNSHSCYSGLHTNWDSNKESSKSSYEHMPKEPLHLDFPLAELENTDYHRNFLKSLKRYKGIDESSRTLNQGDISSPFAKKQKKELPSKVAEDQNQRRSRLRRLKSNELYNAIGEGSENDLCNDKTDRDCSSTRSEEEEPKPTDAKFSDGELKRSGSMDQNRGEETYDEWMDPYERKSIQDFEDEETKIGGKNKRQNSVRLYERERSTHARDTKKVLDEYERSQEKIGLSPSNGKSYIGNDRNEGSYYYSSQRENYKDAKGMYDDSNQIRGPLFLLQKKDKGENLMETFANGGGSRRDSEIDSAEDLARMLSKDIFHYVVLGKVPGKEQDIVCNQNNGQLLTEHLKTRSNSAPDARMLDNYKITESDMIMKAHGPVSGEEVDLGKVKGAFKGEQVETAFEKKESKIKDLSSFFKSKNQQTPQRKNDENKVGATYPENSVDVLDPYQKSEQQDKSQSHSAPLSQFYRYIKDFNYSQQSKEMEDKMKGIFGEKQLKTSKSNPNERQNYFFPDKTLNPSEKEFQYVNSNAKIGPDSSVIQLNIPEGAQKGTGGSGKYYLYGADSDVSNSPKHEIRVMQNDFTLQPDNYNYYSNPQAKMYQNKIVQNPMQSGKMTFSSSAGIPSGGVNPGYPITQTNSLRYANSMTKQPGFNASADYKRIPENTSEMKSNGRRMAKKTGDSNNEFHPSGTLKRFIRDFQYFADQQNGDNVMIPKTPLQELTGYGGKHLQDLNNLLREIMNNKIINAREEKKNLIRGMPQKYEDQKDRPVAEMEADNPRVGSGGWTSLVYKPEIPNAYHFESLDRNRDVRELDKSRPAERNSLPKLEGADGVGAGSTVEGNPEAGQNYFKRGKRDLKKIPKNSVNGMCMGEKVQSASTTHTSIQGDNLSSLSREYIKKGRSVKEEKNNFHTSARTINSNVNENVLSEKGRKLLSIPETEPSENLSDKERQNAECTRENLQNHLDPLVLGKRDASRKKTENEDYAVSVGSSDERKSLDEKNLKSDAKKSIPEKAAEYGDGTNIKIRIVGGDFTGEAKAYDGASSMSGEGKSSQESHLADVTGQQNRISDAVGQVGKNQLVDMKKNHENNPELCEIYVMDEKQIKKKFAGTKNDQVNEKHRCSGPAAQSQAVYNSGRVANGAASSQQVIPPPINYGPNMVCSHNSSASKQEDKILRNNLKVGNAKVYTYQASEESTLCPVEEKVEDTKSNEFERIDAKNKMKIDIQVPSADAHVYYNPGTRESSYLPDIVYKDDKKQLLTNMGKNPSELLPKKDAELYKENDYNARIEGNPCKNENGCGNANPYQNVPAREHVNPNPVLDGTNQMGTALNVGQATGIRIDSNCPKSEEENGNQQQTSFPSGGTEIHGDENLNYQMIQAWNTYARSQLTRSKLKGLANKEYLNYRRSFESMIGLADLEKAKKNTKETRVEVKMSPDVNGSSEKNFDSNLLESVEKIGNDRLQSENSGIHAGKRFAQLKEGKSKRYPVEVGKRVFYSFRSEPPDEYLKRNEMSGQTFDSNAVGSSIATKNSPETGNRSGDWKSSIGNIHATGQDSEAETILLTDRVSLPDTSNLREKRWSSGHLTESHYRKYHKKNFNGKREMSDKSRNEVESCIACEEVIRAKRDAYDEAIQADMQRRMEEERKVRNMLDYIDVSKKLPLALPAGDTLAGISEERNELGNKVSRFSDSDASKVTQQQQQQQQTYTKTESPLLYKSYSIQRGPNVNRFESRHTIVSRSQPEKYEDNVFIRGIQTRKSRKFSDEGFEMLTPDMRFSDKGKANGYVEENSNKKASWMQMPYNAQLLENVNQGYGIQDHFGYNNGVNFGATRYSGDESPGIMGMGYNNNDYPGMMAYNNNYYSEAESNNGYNDFSEMIAYNKKYNNRKMEENQGVPDKGNAPESAPKQKLIHALSHEAPLLTSSSFINQPTDYSNVQDVPINAGHEKTTIIKQSSLADYPNEADLMVSFHHLSEPQVVPDSSSLPEASHKAPLSKPNFEDSQKTSEPIMGAVVLLARQDQLNERQQARLNKLGKRNAMYFGGSKCPGRCPTDSGKTFWDERKPYGEEFANRGRSSVKRSPRMRESRSEKDADTDSGASDQTQHTVNDSVGSGSCGGDGDTKTCNTNKTNNFKLPSFPFSQSQNIKTDTRNEQKDATANCGEQILEAIFGKVESNPQFRKIIGPGLKWRTKQEEDKESGCGQGKKCRKNDAFVLKLREIMRKFMCDIEKLAEQEPKRSCSKLDSEINRFLREMLEASCDNEERPTPKPCRPQVEPLLRTHCMSKPCSNGDQNSNAKTMSSKDLKRKQNLIVKLLAEYQSLSQSDKKKMEPVGKYLEQQLEEMKVNMNATAENETCNNNKDKGAEDKTSKEKITGNKWSEDKSTEEKHTERTENKCPEGKDADNKNTADDSSQTKCPKDKGYFEKKGNNTCPEDKTFETKISDSKWDNNKSSKPGKDAENKCEDKNVDDKNPRNECPKEKNVGNTNIEDRITKSDTAEKNCNKTRNFEDETVDEEKSSNGEHTEYDSAAKSVTASYPVDNIAEEGNERKKEFRSEGNALQRQAEGSSHFRKDQNMRLKNSPISGHAAMQNVNDAPINLPFIWSNPDDMNLLGMDRPEHSLPNLHKNRKYQLERGESSSSVLPSARENVPSETYEEQMLRGLFPARSNLAISAKKKKHASANYPIACRRKGMGSVFEVERQTADSAQAKKFDGDSSEISGVEELEKLGMLDGARLRLSLKHQDSVGSKLDSDKTGDGPWKQDARLLNNEPMSSNIDVAVRKWMKAPEGLSKTPASDAYQKNVGNTLPTMKGGRSESGTAGGFSSPFHRRIDSYRRRRRMQPNRSGKNFVQGPRSHSPVEPSNE